MTADNQFLNPFNRSIPLAPRRRSGYLTIDHWGADDDTSGFCGKFHFEQHSVFVQVGF